MKIQKIFERSEKMPNKAIITIQTNEQKLLDRILKMLAYIEYCSNVGHSTEISISIDGDGSDRVKISGIDKKYDFKNIESSKRDVEPIWDD